MIRDELYRLRHSLRNASSMEKTAYIALVFVTLMIIGGLINFAPIDAGFKITLFIFTITALLFISFCIYRHQLNQSSPDDDAAELSPKEQAEKKAENDTKEGVKPTIPEKPSSPPTISVEKSVNNAHSEDFEIADEDVIMKYKEENPSSYRRPFSIKPVIFKIVLSVSFWIGFLIGAITQDNPVTWWVFVVLTIFTPIYCYYLVLRWNGEEFVVNDMWFERPLTMPFPFSSQTPAIRRSEIGKYEFKQTTLDKLLGTCRLYSDTPSAHDKNFHNVKWLTHPAELRRATGISAPRRNSWLSPFRKNKG